MASMDALAKLDRCDFEPAVKAQVTELLLALTVELTAKDVKIAALTHELAYYKRIRFGQKTEALAGLQRDLFREEVETDLAAIEAELESLKAIYAPEGTPRPTVAVPRPPRTGRQPLPDHLPRIEHRHEPESCTCGQCGGALAKIRDDITEQLDVEPAKFFVRRHLCPLGISAPSTPAGLAKRWLQKRCRQPSSTAAWRRQACWLGWSPTNI